MNRKEFLDAIAGFGVLAMLWPRFAAARSCQGADEQATRAAQTSKNNGTQFKSKRVITTFAGHIGFPPKSVFPLLCPVREYQWLDGWQCEMIYSDSGVAEDNCIFKTAHAGGMVWCVSRYEPPHRIEFTTFGLAGMVTRLNLSLTATQNGTDLRWTRIFTGLDETGNRSVGMWTTERDAELTRGLEHYLKTGEILRGSTVGK